MPPSSAVATDPLPFTAIHRWAKHRQVWLATRLPLANGIPSRDCIRRLLIVLKPDAFQRCFQQWIAAAIPADPNAPAQRLVAIDGKTCRGSHNDNALGPLHIVSAWASEEGIALGQVATDESSNEITAIPELLKQITLENTIVTIDAMGCQKEIVQQIVAGGGDAVLAVKGNQPKLHAAVKTFFDEQIARDFEDLKYRSCETCDAGHGTGKWQLFHKAGGVELDSLQRPAWSEIPEGIGPNEDYARLRR